MTVPFTKLAAIDPATGARVTGPTAAILILANMPAARTALADTEYRRLVKLDSLGAWATASAALDARERDALAVLAPADDTRSWTCRHCGRKAYDDGGPWGGRILHTENGEATCGTARRVTIHEAKRHFAAGGKILVSEYGHETTCTIGPLTTTHDRARTDWDALTGDVETWRNRHPNQRYYIVNDTTAPAGVTA